MCGLAGFVSRDRGAPAELGSVVRAMAARLAHRGPDDEGTWVDADTGVALGHRRLSIIDLSPHGHQPMLSATGRFVIAFNGEIYNFAQLRSELEIAAHGAIQWRGHSDTEVLLAAVEVWGVEAALTRLAGMFAFALWDRDEHRLYLARDRMGEKPLYYGWSKDVFLFGSELKALSAHPTFHSRIDRNALALYLRFNCIPAPHTIYQGIRKLEVGSLATLTVDRVRERQDPLVSRYWSLDEVAERGIAQRLALDDAEATEHLDRLLGDAVARQLVADVPIGAFLSGGVDSSTVVALMQARSAKRVKTFTVGFTERDYDEAAHARTVARHLGTDHTELYVTPKAAMAVIPRLPQVYDEPFADSSQIPTLLVSELARTTVKVSLSGDGGDELFGGYNRYVIGHAAWRIMRRTPGALRAVTAALVAAVSPESWDRAYRAIRPLLPLALRYGAFGDRVHKLATILGAESPEALYRTFVSHWDAPLHVAIGASEPSTLLAPHRYPRGLEEFSERMMWIDALTYLPDDILVKVDRAAMAVGLESRLPLLDHRVVEWTWRLPLSMKIRNGNSKWLLRQVLYQYVPRQLIERPKMGFSIPLDSWLRGPLRDWAEALLSESRLKREGYLNSEPVRRRWNEHLSGARNWQHALWGALVFQAWLEAQAA